jgi:hypothetical protein
VNSFGTPSELLRISNGTTPHFLHTSTLAIPCHLAEFSYGNGMRLGRVNEPRPLLRSIQRTNTTSSVTVTGMPGQRVILSASPDLRAWAPVATNIMFTKQFTLGDTSPAAVRFFRAEVR